MIVQELHAIQERCGYLPVQELRALSERTNTPLHRLHEVASFYPHYRLQPPPAVEVAVCRDMSCHLRGSRELRRNVEALAGELGPSVVVKGVSCLGRCDSAPSAISINDQVYWGLSEKEILARVRAAAANESLPHQHGARTPVGWRIDPYEDKPRYDALKNFVQGADAAALL
jgi:NADH:ubiquinone oxidoreductase subunit E